MWRIAFLIKEMGMLIQGRANQVIALLAAAGIGAGPSHAESQHDSIAKQAPRDETISSVTQKDTPKQAQTADGTPPSSTSSLPSLVTNAERLAIKFLGYAELAGEYRLSADDAISIPVLGRI